MENIYYANKQAISLYKATYEVKDWYDHVKANLSKVVGALKDYGFRCAVCESGEVAADDFKNDDYSELSRCAKCLNKTRA